MVHATVEPGARLVLPWPREFNALVYVLAGRGALGTPGAAVRTGNMVVFGAGDNLAVSADTDQDAPTPQLEVLVLGGRPIGEPVAAYGPFVMNTRAEIAQAFEDYEKGKLGTIPADHIGH
jgi:quercetin 2,3-dioxygenase